MRTALVHPPPPLRTRVADPRRPGTPAYRSRARRHELFRALVAGLPRPVRVLDVGGTEEYWRTMGVLQGLEITCVNPLAEASGTPGLAVARGDARALAYEDGAFDVVFSNSVIEHVGGPEDQRRAADEMRRVGRAFFVQTPNRHFPLEPHFLFPGFQYLPLEARAWLLSTFRLGWYTERPGRDEARRAAASIELLDRRAFERLFPGATIWEDRLLGLVKSFVAYGGFPR